jgi:hypothetical protein
MKPIGKHRGDSKEGTVIRGKGLKKELFFGEIVFTGTA